MKLNPIGDIIVIEPDTPSTVSAGGIHLPETEKAKPQTGKVLSVGNGAYTESGFLIPMQIKVGETVLFNRFAGTEYKNGSTVLLLRQKDILAVVEKSADKPKKG